MTFEEKLAALPDNVKDYFMSNDSRLAKEKACFLYDIKEEDLIKMKVVGNALLNEIEIRDVPMKIIQELRVDNPVAYGIAWELNKNIFTLFPEYFRDAQELLQKWETLKCAPLVSEEKARRRLLDLEPWIEEEEREKAQAAKVQAEEERKEQAKFEKIRFSEALKKYSKLGEQGVTAGMIKLKYFENPVRPSIKNWMTDYQDFAGAGKHTAVERGNFLFHTENAKKLTPFERQKLTFILRVIDEDIEVQVDPVAQLLLFNLETEKEVPRANFIAQKPPITQMQADVSLPKQMPAQSMQPKPSLLQSQEKLNAFAPVARPFPTEKPTPVQNNKPAATPVQNKILPNNAVVNLKTEKNAEPRFMNMAPFGKVVNLANMQQARTVAQQEDAVVLPQRQVLQQKEQVLQARPVVSKIVPEAKQTAPQGVQKEDNAAGKISFSSPQQFVNTPSVHQKNNFATKRSPYRITPRGYEYNNKN